MWLDDVEAGFVSFGGYFWVFEGLVCGDVVCGGLVLFV